jgi:hypothetical protein
MSVNDDAGLQAIFSAAIGAGGRPGVGDIEKNAGMHAPERSVRPGTEDRKIFSAHLDNFVRAGRGSDICTHGYS